MNYDDNLFNTLLEDFFQFTKKEGMWWNSAASESGTQFLSLAKIRQKKTRQKQATIKQLQYAAASSGVNEKASVKCESKNV